MNFYSRVIFPWLCDWAMGQKFLAPYRQETLSRVSGEILEVGMGTARNLMFYPPAITHLSAVDVHPRLHWLARRRLRKRPIQVNYQSVSGSTLPFENQSFDCVVSTFTLCSIEDVGQALSEIARVLKPQGRYFFLEHGASPEARVCLWQNRLTPFWKPVAGGCHLNRDIHALIDAAGFRITQIQQFYVTQAPKLLGYVTQGGSVLASVKCSREEVPSNVL